LQLLKLRYGVVDCHEIIFCPDDILNETFFSLDCGDYLVQLLRVTLLSNCDQERYVNRYQEQRAQVLQHKRGLGDRDTWHDFSYAAEKHAVESIVEEDKIPGVSVVVNAWGHSLYIPKSMPANVRAVSSSIPRLMKTPDNIGNPLCW
jgi:hypothetical protein